MELFTGQLRAKCEHIIMLNFPKTIAVPKYGSESQVITIKTENKIQCTEMKFLYGNYKRKQN